MGVGDQCHALAPLCLLERSGTHFIGCWMGLKAGLDKCGNSLPTGIQSLELPARNESLYRRSYLSSYTLMPLTIALNLEIHNWLWTWLFLKS